MRTTCASCFVAQEEPIFYRATLILRFQFCMRKTGIFFLNSELPTHVQVFSARKIPLLPNTSLLALPVLHSQNWFIALKLEAQVKFLNGNKRSVTCATYLPWILSFSFFTLLSSTSIILFNAAPKS